MGIKWQDVKLGVSPLTQEIYIGKTKLIKGGFEEWTDKSEPKTQDILKAVFEWFMRRHENEKTNSVSFEMGDKKYELNMTITEATNE